LIIRRYLVKQVVSTSLVVIALLTLIMMGGRLIKYFGVAAQGRLDAGILFSIIGYRLPEFLTLILPLGFFIGLMLVNFEWSEGYNERFGLIYLDYATGKRTPKDSAAWYAKVAETNGKNL
jgi:hypothetical protein